MTTSIKSNLHIRNGSTLISCGCTNQNWHQTWGSWLVTTMGIKMLHMLQRVKSIHEMQAGFSVEYQSIHSFLQTNSAHLFPSAGLTKCALAYQPPVPQKHHPLFLAKFPLKSANYPSLLFLGNPLYILVFLEPSLKLGFFCEPPKH